MKALSVPVNELIQAASEKLKQLPEIQAPAWAGLVKTGSHAERPPQEEGFWFKRCAALLVSVIKTPAGLRALQHKYGGKKEHKVSRSHHAKAGGKSIRLAFQQLEKAGLVKKEKKGRAITPKGLALLDKAAQ